MTKDKALSISEVKNMARGWLEFVKQMRPTNIRHVSPPFIFLPTTVRSPAEPEMLDG